MKKYIFTLVLILITLILSAQVPTPNPANNTFNCINDIQVYGDQVIDPLATYSFTIVPAQPFTSISGGDQIQVTWSTPGVYVITITETVGICSSSSQATINVYPPTTPLVITDIICVGNGTIALTSTPLGTNPIFSGTGVTGNTFNATGLAQGIYPITFTSTDANGCPMTGTGSVTITSPPPPPTIFTN
jgi:hypothetical protein